MKTVYILTLMEPTGYINTIQFDNMPDLAYYLTDLSEENKYVINTVQFDA